MVLSYVGMILGWYGTVLCSHYATLLGMILGRQDTVICGHHTALVWMSLGLHGVILCVNYATLVIGISLNGIDETSISTVSRVCFASVWVFCISMVWSALPATSVRLGTVLMHSHTAHMPQPTMCSPVANLQQVAKLACIMLRNDTPGWIRTPRPWLPKSNALTT